MLRQWYAKYHPDSGPLRISSAEELESLLGEDLRKYYGHLKDYALHTALQQRVKPVLLSRQVITTWIQRHRPEAVSRKRPAVALKRPAAAMKRPAAAQSVSDDAPAEPPRKRAATASVSIKGADGIEAACGERYRREVSDLGLGLQRREMQEKLESWGHAVTREGCTVWLQRYRFKMVLLSKRCFSK